MYCDSLSQPALIQDGNPAGVTNTITIPAGGTINDLNVRLDISHPFVGDLVVTLRHVETGTTVTLLNRPGLSYLTDGCFEADVSCTFDDAATQSADSQCTPSSAAGGAIDGGFTPTTPLSAFNGQSLAGQWQLNVSDRATGDVGSLLGWCLVPNTAAPSVSSFTCNGSSPCAITFDEAFALEADYTDANGNASHYRVVEYVYDYDLDAWVVNGSAEGAIAPPSGSGMLLFDVAPFTCPNLYCDTMDVAYTITVSDVTGLKSTPVDVYVTVFGIIY